MRMSPLLADFIHARACKPFCEKSLTLPDNQIIYSVGIAPFLPKLALKPNEILDKKSALIFRKVKMIFLLSHM